MRERFSNAVALKAEVGVAPQSDSLSHWILASLTAPIRPSGFRLSRRCASWNRFSPWGSLWSLHRDSRWIQKISCSKLCPLHCGKFFFSLLTAVLAPWSNVTLPGIWTGTLSCHSAFCGKKSISFPLWGVTVKDRISRSLQPLKGSSAIEKVSCMILAGHFSIALEPSKDCRLL